MTKRCFDLIDQIQKFESTALQQFKRFISKSENRIFSRISTENVFVSSSRYCAMLSSGESLTPIFRFDSTDSKDFQCTLTMPINSPIRDDVIVRSTISFRNPIDEFVFLHFSVEREINVLPNVNVV